MVPTSLTATSTWETPSTSTVYLTHLYPVLLSFLNLEVTTGGTNLRSSKKSRVCLEAWWNLASFCKFSNLLRSRPLMTGWYGYLRGVSVIRIPACYYTTAIRPPWNCRPRPPDSFLHRRRGVELKSSCKLWTYFGRFSSTDQYVMKACMCCG